MFRRLCAAWDGGASVLGRVYYVPAAAGSAERDLLLALFNSRLYAVLYAGWFAGVAQSGGYLRLNAPYLHAMPWPRLGAGPEVAAAVRALERSGGAGPRQALDAAVEDLFDLSAAERAALGRLAPDPPGNVSIPHAAVVANRTAAAKGRRTKRTTHHK